MKIRIAKFIATSGIASRRDAERMIADGRVAVNGAVVQSPIFFVEDTDTVTIDGTAIGNATETRLYMFHKPVNVMTTTRDPMGRKTIYDVLPKEYRTLKYVGRLDFKTSGLLLLTNDGELARKLTLPSSQIPRTYIAKVGGNLDNLDKARNGIIVDGIHYRPMQIDVIGQHLLRVTVTEGKKNEIRIVLRACGAPVTKLHRVSFGKIKLGDLQPGKVMAVSQKTIDLMLKSL